MSDLEIRAYEPADLPRLQEIRVRAFADIQALFRKTVGEEIYALHLKDEAAKQGSHLDSICKPDSGKSVYVAVKNGLIVGFVGVGMNAAHKTGEIDLNAVDPDCQGQGIGTTLYEFAVARMQEAGMKIAMVGTGGDAAHAPARRAYEKAGFAVGIPSVHLYRVI